MISTDYTPLIWVQCKVGNDSYDLVNGETGEIIGYEIPGSCCDRIFADLDKQNAVYVRQFN